jgi:putative SOS response-associated peptidase YedK
VPEILSERLLRPQIKLEPFHDRQIYVLPPASGMDWLTLKRPESDLLKTPPKGTFTDRTLRQNGVESA